MSSEIRLCVPRSKVFDRSESDFLSSVVRGFTSSKSSIKTEELLNHQQEQVQKLVVLVKQDRYYLKEVHLHPVKHHLQKIQ